MKILKHQIIKVLFSYYIFMHVLSTNLPNKQNQLIAQWVLNKLTEVTNPKNMVAEE